MFPKFEPKTGGCFLLTSQKRCQRAALGLEKPNGKRTNGEPQPSFDVISVLFCFVLFFLRVPCAPVTSPRVQIWQIWTTREGVARQILGATSIPKKTRGHALLTPTPNIWVWVLQPFGISPFSREQIQALPRRKGDLCSGPMERSGRWPPNGSFCCLCPLWHRLNLNPLSNSTHTGVLQNWGDPTQVIGFPLVSLSWLPFKTIQNKFPYFETDPCMNPGYQLLSASKGPRHTVDHPLPSSKGNGSDRSQKTIMWSINLREPIWGHPK